MMHSKPKKAMPAQKSGYKDGGHVKAKGGMKAPNTPCGTQGPGVRSPQDYGKKK
jgi:hypothetical protein